MSRFIRAIKQKAFGLLILLPAFLYLCGFFLLILYHILVLSLTYVTPELQEIFPSAQNFVELSQEREFVEATRNTVLFTVIGTPLELLAGLFVALLMHREFRGRGIFRSFFILPLAIPSIVTAIILFILFDYPFGHINDLLLGRYEFLPPLIDQPVNWRGSALFSLGVAMFGKIWRDTPISMLIILAGLQSIEEDQYEAAETMGAGVLHRFRYITLPLLIPAMSTVLVLRSIEMWKEFIFPFILAGRYPLLATLIEEAYHSWNLPSQAATISLILIFFIALSTMCLFGILGWMRKRLVRI